MAKKLKRPRKKKPMEGEEQKGQMTLKALAKALEEINRVLSKAERQVDELYVALYTKGLDQRGPLVEDDDDLPF